jgi:hypothetical protein
MHCHKEFALVIATLEDGSTIEGHQDESGETETTVEQLAEGYQSGVCFG